MRLKILLSHVADAVSIAIRMIHSIFAFHGGDDTWTVYNRTHTVLVVEEKEMTC